MKIELVIIILIFVLLNSQHTNNTTKTEKFNNKKYFNLQKELNQLIKENLQIVIYLHTENLLNQIKMNYGIHIMKL